MATLEEAADALNRMIETLSRPALDIDPDRQDWSSAAADLDTVLQQVKAGLEAVNGVDNAEGRRELRRAASWSVGRAGAVLVNAGRFEGGAIVREASEMDPDSPALRFGRRDPEGFVRMIAALELREGGKARAADAALQALALERPDPDLDQVIKDLKRAGKPVTSAPALGSINGFGFTVFGRRDPHPDGSYVTTHWLTALFIPVFPLGAYRVVDQGGGVYGFMSKVPVSRFVARYRQALVAVVVLVGALLGFQVFYNRPDQQAVRAFAAAQARAEQAPPGESPQAWQDFLVHRHIDKAPYHAKVATRKLLEARIAAIPSPFRPESLAAAEKAVGEYAASR